MGYNKDLNITPIPLLDLYSNNYTTSHARAQCDISEISGKDEQIITGQSRWNPTPEQMMVLQEVYSSGMRRPTTQQIQEIACKLQKYGKIEGKNVFYWFQNHKSRERLKRRRHSQQERFGFNNVHGEPLRKDEALENKNLSVSKRRGYHRVIHTMTCLSSSSTYPQNNYIDHGKMEEYGHRGMEEEKEATCQNQINRINTFYHMNITSKRSQEREPEVSFNEHQYYNLNEDEEEETRISRTLDLFPVRENQEKTGFAEKNTKPNHLCCNYYYYYEFMPLMN